MACLSDSLGIRFRAYLPRNSPKITEILERALGAEEIRTEYESTSEEMIEMVREASKEENALNLNQFSNEANFEAHYRFTAREIEEQLESIGSNPPRAILAGIGTSGHIAGIESYFKENTEKGSRSSE